MLHYNFSRCYYWGKLLQITRHLSVLFPTAARESTITIKIKNFIKRPTKMGRRPKQTFLRRRHRWLSGTWKGVQLLLEKCKSKLQWGYQLTSAKMAIIKKSINSKYWTGCGEKGTLLCCWWECKMVQPLQRAVWSFLKKTKNRATIGPCNPTPGNICGEKQVGRDTHPSVHCSVVYNSQKLEATQVPINRGMDKEDVVHTYNEILLGH